MEVPATEPTKEMFVMGKAYLQLYILFNTLIRAIPQKNYVSRERTCKKLLCSRNILQWWQRWCPYYFLCPPPASVDTHAQLSFSAVHGSTLVTPPFEYTYASLYLSGETWRMRTCIFLLKSGEDPAVNGRLKGISKTD